MKTRTRFTIAGVLTGAAAVLLLNRAPSSSSPPAPQNGARAATLQKHSRVTVRQDRRHQAEQEGPLLPAPAVHTAPISGALPGGPETVWPAASHLDRPPEESMMSSWAARDPEGAGRWLNQNRNHPKFADYVRGYAIQIAVTDPAAARAWAGTLRGNGNRFSRGGTLEQHIEAVELMLRGPSTSPEDSAANPVPLFVADYTPVLVRQHPDEAPVLEMQPVSLFG